MTNLRALPDLPKDLTFEGGDEEKRGRGRPRKSNATRLVFNGIEHIFKFAVSEGTGNSKSDHVSHPPSIAARIQYLVENPELPYKSRADVWRDAIYWYLEFIDAWWKDGGFSRYMEITRRQAQSNHHRMMNQIETNLVSDTAEGLDEMVKSENWEQLKEAIPHGHQVARNARVNTEVLVEALKRAEAATR